MATYAIVEAGVIVNVIVWDGAASFAPPNGATVVDIPDGTYTGVGCTYVNGAFSAPPNTGGII